MKTCILRTLVTACILGCLLTGCTVVGPAAVHSGRLAYNEAIIETDNQQILLVVVRNRYGERSNLLAVTSVTANVRVTTNAGIELGIGDSDDYAGNLVPFRAGMIYEENPTISYTPVGGEEYLRELMSPVSVTSLAQFTGNLVDPAPVYYALVSSVNGIYNPDFMSTPSEPDVRFIRVVSIITELAQAQRLHWIQDPGQVDRFSIIIDHYAQDHAEEVHELLTLLGISIPQNLSSPIRLPVYLALEGQHSGGIGITMRSVYDLLEILSGAVEVPQQDHADGVAISYPSPGMVGKQLRVRYSETRPENASVAVEYRNGWFYIDDKDQATKQFFRLLTALLSVNISENSSGTSAAPVLTVPVSR
jgi:hypothetical protein